MVEHPSGISVGHASDQGEYMSGNQARNSELWRAVCNAGGEAVFVGKQGMLPTTLTKTVLDCEEGGSEPCVVLELNSGKIAFGTKTFEDLVGKGRQYQACLQGEDIREILRPENLDVDQVVNGDRWQMLSKMSKTREPVIALMLCKSFNGNIFWSVIHSFPVEVPSFGAHLVAVLTVLETPVPHALTRLSSNEDAADENAFLKNLLAKLHKDVRVQIVTGSEETVAVLCQKAEQSCKAFAAALADSYEGDHCVPLVGADSVRAFEQLSCWEALCGDMEQEMKTAWEVNDEVYRDTREEGAKSIACVVADPSARDCPLVYISPGFEFLTQYRRTWALGRNCRFLQPNARSKNNDFNGTEISRMKTFCLDKRGTIITFLLNEKVDGSYFWNLLFMEHRRCKGAGTKIRSYIFAVQTNIVCQKGLLDTLVLEAWESGNGKDNLSRLRELFQESELTYSPRQTSLKRLGDTLIAKWAMEVGRENACSWEGASYVPKVGLHAVEEFAGLHYDYSI